jgi:hypothetical protein
VAYASEAPAYENGDLVVPADVVDQLRALAGATPVSRATEGARPGPTLAQNTGKLTLSARPAVGRAAIVVDGTAPGPVPVTITLAGTMSQDIPDVVLSRVTLATDGTFHATLAVANIPRGSVVTVTATSLPGVPPASARVTVGAPHPDVNTNLDHLPKDPL